MVLGRIFRKGGQEGQDSAYTPFGDLSEKEKQFVYSHVRRFFEEVETKKYKVHVRVFLAVIEATRSAPIARDRGCVHRR